MASNSETILQNSKGLIELLNKIQENLSKSSSKNDSLLEAIESSEEKATQAGTNEAPLLRNLRARLAAAHTPNSALRRDLTTFSGILEKRCGELESALQNNSALKKQLKHEQHDLEVRIKSYERERTLFEEERAEWKEELDQAREEIIEQNDRLAVLSESLAGTKNELDMKKNELASQRIAFEEEKLSRINDDDDKPAESEADALRIKLKQQVIRNVELENSLLHTELALHQKEEHVDELNQQNERLKYDISQRRLAATRSVKQFDARIADTNKKLAQMNSELMKSQENARKFQDLLTVERRKLKGIKHALEQEIQKNSGGSGNNPLALASQKAYVETLAESLSAHSKHQSYGSMKTEDVLRKAETVMVENATLKAEIRKLRIENSDLLKRIRFSDTNAHYMRNQLVTNISDRTELMKRLEKAEVQYHELEQSLAKQASEWVSLKKRESKAINTLKWNQIQPIPVLGASERTWSSPARKGNSRPIVQKW